MPAGWFLDKSAVHGMGLGTWPTLFLVIVNARESFAITRFQFSLPLPLQLSFFEQFVHGPPRLLRLAEQFAVPNPPDGVAAVNAEFQQSPKRVN